MHARVAELADAPDLGSGTARYRSSSLLSRTIFYMSAGGIVTGAVLMADADISIRKADSYRFSLSAFMTFPK